MLAQRKCGSHGEIRCAGEMPQALGGSFRRDCMQEHWTCYQDSGKDMLTPKHLLKKSRIPKYPFCKNIANCTRNRPCVDRERQDAVHGSEQQRSRCKLIIWEPQANACLWASCYCLQISPAPIQDCRRY
jgi:hypothetical protein